MCTSAGGPDRRVGPAPGRRLPDAGTVKPLDAAGRFSPALYPRILPGRVQNKRTFSVNTCVRFFPVLSEHLTSRTIVNRVFSGLWGIWPDPTGEIRMPGTGQAQSRRSPAGTAPAAGTAAASQWRRGQIRPAGPRLCWQPAPPVRDYHLCHRHRAAGAVLPGVRPYPADAGAKEVLCPVGMYSDQPKGTSRCRVAEGGLQSV